MKFGSSHEKFGVWPWPLFILSLVNSILIPRKQKIWRLTRPLLPLKGGVMVNFFDLTLPDCKNELSCFVGVVIANKVRLQGKRLREGFFFL